MTDCAPHDLLRRFATRARRLYSLPAVALQVVELTRQPEIDIPAVRACIERDPALASKVLRTVNSSLFGLSQPVANLQQALTLLGSKTIRVLVLGFSLPQELLRNVASRFLARFWRRALVKAVAARELSERIWTVAGDEAFLAGLLQDVGMLALIQDLGEPYVLLLEKATEKEADLSVLENGAFGFDHTQLSAEMLRAWNFPESFARAIATSAGVDSAQPPLPPPEPLTQILQLAARVTEFLLQERVSLLRDILDAGRPHGELSLSQLEEVVRAIDKKVPQLAEALNLQPLDDLDYARVLLDAHCLLCEAADALAAEPRRSPEPAGDSAPPPRPAEESATALGKTDRRTATANVGQPLRTRLLRASTTPVSNVALTHQLEAAIGRCRQARQPISLALAEVDDLRALRVSMGTAEADGLARDVAAAIATALARDGRVLELPASRIAVLLENCDRQQGVALARQVVRLVERRSLEPSRVPCCLSVGLATLAMPPRNFPPREMVLSAERCLRAVQLSGGNGVKSIDI